MKIKEEKNSFETLSVNAMLSSRTTLERRIKRKIGELFSEAIDFHLPSIATYLTPQFAGIPIKNSKRVEIPGVYRLARFINPFFDARRRTGRPQ